MAIPIPRLSLLPVFMRELLGSRTLPREPEPDLVMNDTEQVAAYTEAGRIDGIMAAAYLFHSARISQVIQGCEQVLDLGCGPATQLSQVAGLNPAISFTGTDLSSEMLKQAEAHAREQNLDNVRFECCDITRLEPFDDQSFDGVISTMTLHHLPTEEHLRLCFREINRVLRPGGALYLVDFGRLKSLKSVIFFAYMNRDQQPHIFTLDFERSMRAAFLFENFQQLATDELPPSAQLFSTFRVPFLTLIKTADKPLPAELARQLGLMRRELPRRYGRDLEDLRIFFRLGGLRNDPFSLRHS